MSIKNMELDPEIFDEAIKCLSDFIKIKSINPPGNERPALDFLAKILENEGLKTVIYETAPNRGVLVCKIQGENPYEKSVVMLNHVDVVQANEKYWKRDPFGGEVVDNYIWGRGALDMKCLGIIELSIMLAIKRSGKKPRRNIVYLAVSDEEKGGKFGAKWVVDNLLDEINPGVIFNEGGYGMKNVLIKGTLFTVEVGQKTNIKLRVRAVGQPGHGNAPGKDSSIITLSRALNRITKYDFPIKVHPIIKELFKRIAVKKSFPENYIMSNLDNLICKKIIARELKKDKSLNAHMRNTVSITTFNAGEAFNVIPSEAEATLDLRMLPGEESKNVINTIKSVMDEENLEVEVINEIYNNTTTEFNTEEFKIIEKEIIKKYPEAIVSPYLDIGGTDSKYFRIKGIPCYGIIPAVINKEELASIHGNNERISLENYTVGLEITFNIIKALSER